VPPQQTDSILTFKRVPSVPSTKVLVQSLSETVPSPLSEHVPSTAPSPLPSSDQKTNGKLMSIPDVPSKSEVESTNELPNEKSQEEEKSFLLVTPTLQQRITIKRKKRIQAVLETPLKNPTAKKSCPPVKIKKSKSILGASI